MRTFAVSLAKLIRGLFPLTWVSIILSALIYYVWFWEVSAHANQILYSVVLLWLLAFAIILFFTIVTSIVVFVVTYRTNRGVVFENKNEVGGFLETHYKVLAPVLIPFVTIDIELLEKGFQRKDGRDLLWCTETLVPTERGRYETLHRKITIRDIFGLTAVSFVLKQTVCLEIMPATSKFEMIALRNRTTGDGFSHPEGDPKGELIEMRRYQAGDPLRLVLWKVFARSRKLVVRAPEPAIVEENDMFVYFICGERDETSASMARSILSSFGVDNKDLSFAADGAKRIVLDEKEGLSDVIDSVSERNRGGEDLLTIAPLVKEAAMAHCFLLVPQTKGPWFDYVKKFVSNFQVSPTFIMSVDAQSLKKGLKKPSVLKKWMCSLNETEDFEEQRQALCKDLSALGNVRIVDTATGAFTEFTGDTK